MYIVYDTCNKARVTRSQYSHSQVLQLPPEQQRQVFKQNPVLRQIFIRKTAEQLRKKKVYNSLCLSLSISLSLSLSFSPSLCLCLFHSLSISISLFFYISYTLALSLYVALSQIFLLSFFISLSLCPTPSVFSMFNTK